MQTTQEVEKLELLQNLLHQGQHKALQAILEEMPVVEVADFLALQPIQVMTDLLRRFSPQNQGNIVSDLDPDLQLKLFRNLPRADFAVIFTHMSSDIRADLYQELELEEQDKLIPFLNKKIRQDVLHLSRYEPESAGGIMNTDFATVLLTMTVEEAIAKVRKDAPSKKMVYYIYVVDQHMRLQGFVTLKNLIMAHPADPVATCLNKNYVFAEVDEDQESVAGKIERYDLVAIPVVNAEGQLVGIVSHDDALDIIRQENTEDFERFMGIMSQGESPKYLETPALTHFRKRVVWIISLAAVGIISGVIIHQYEDTLSALLILALYMPMVADTGGNVGSQAATVVVRAMALGEVTVKNWARILFKEVRVALMVAICLGLIAFGKVMFLSFEADLPAQYNLGKVAFVIALALAMQTVSATLIGAGLPLVVKRLGGDPAVGASPAITTVVDITGLLIYFGVAKAMLF